MTSSDSVHLFLQLAVMLSAALVFGSAARLLKMPAVLGEIVGGILIGPTLAGQAAPQLHHFLFSSSPAVLLGQEAFIKVGMLLFLFVTGTEVQLSQIREKKSSVFWISLFGILIPFASGFLLVMWGPKEWFLMPGKTDILPYALFMGTALSISALPVISRILMDLNLIQTQFGSLVLSSATLDDLIGWSLFSLVLGISGKSLESPHAAGSAIFIAGFFMLALFSENQFLKKRDIKQEKDITASGLALGSTLILVLLAAALAQFLGIHAVFGAFAAGVLLGSRFRQHRVHEALTVFAVNFFAPLYFVSIGLKLNFTAHFDLKICLTIFALACGGKIIGVLLGGAISKLPFRENAAAAFALNARGAMEIILASVAYEHHLISASVYTALIFMALGTSLLSGPVISRLLNLSIFPSKRNEL